MNKITYGAIAILGALSSMSVNAEVLETASSSISALTDSHVVKMSDQEMAGIKGKAVEELILLPRTGILIGMGPNKKLVATKAPVYGVISPDRKFVVNLKKLHRRVIFK